MSIAVDVDRAYVEAVAQIADEVAGPAAATVDRDARFPTEAVEALREVRALSAYVPPELGGEGVSLTALAQGCERLGRRCAASGMVLAMHHIQVAVLVRHHDPGSWFAGYLEDLAREQRLVASVTTEAGTGGDTSRSIASVDVDPDDEAWASFEKQAPTVSYGAYADDLLTTLRAGPDRPEHEQVLVLTRAAETEVEQLTGWDPLGMRGTCSPGFRVAARLRTEQVMPVPYSVVGPESMVPVAHVLWAHLWLGIASDAFERARAFQRKSARGERRAATTGGRQLADLHTALSRVRAQVADALRALEDLSAGDRSVLGTVREVVRFNELKVSVSEQAPELCRQALGIIGMAGYMNGTPFSVGRHVRDAMSGALMVSNERLQTTNAGLLRLAKDL